MQVISTITCDLTRKGAPAIVHAVQYDAGTRYIKVTLTENGVPWTPPADVYGMISIHKPDGKYALYRYLEDGKTEAVVIAGNTVTVQLVGQTLTAAGQAPAAVSFYDVDGNKLSTLVFVLSIQAAPVPDDAIISTDYYKLPMQLIAEATQAANDAAKAANNAADRAETAATNAQMGADRANAAVEHIEPVVDELTEGAAPAIVETASGEVIVVEDSAERALRELRVFGKTVQDGTPSPDAPVPLKTVGESGQIALGVFGKNLAPALATGTNNGIAFAWSDADGALTISGTKTTEGIIAVRYAYLPAALPAGKYTLSLNNAGTIVGTSDRDRVLVRLRNTAASVYSAAITPDAANAQLSVDVGDEAFDSIQIRVGEDLTSVDNLVLRIQLERGGTATLYEPYKGQGITLATPNGLPGIPVYSGGNYTDAAGQQWVCDEVDLARGVYVQRIGRYTFDGSSDELWRTTVTSLTGTSGHYRNVTDIITKQILTPSTPEEAGIMLCTHYINKPSGIRGSWGEVQSINVGIGGSIIVYDDNYNTSDITLWTAWLAENPIDLVYALATPIETPLSASEIAAYKAMLSHKPTTTVYNDEGAHMEVDYVADTKTWINNKIAALSAAIVNNA